METYFIKGVVYRLGSSTNGRVWLRVSDYGNERETYAFMSREEALEFILKDFRSDDLYEQ